MGGAMRRTRVRAATAGLLIATSVGLLGMGSVGKQEVRSNTRAVFTDRDGTRVQAEHVTAAGTTEISGDLGRGTLRVPFDDITSLTFDGGEERGDRKMTIRLRNGESVSMSVRGSLSFHGQTAVGAYEIRARDLRAVELTR